MSQDTAHGRYEALKILREPYLRRARDCALVTIPYLFPHEGASGTTDLPTPFQSVGARGVNSLAGKLLLALFPPNTPFFELKVDDFTIREMGGGQEGEDARAEIDSVLASITRAVQQQVEAPGTRTGAHEALKNLVTGGNVLWEQQEGSIRIHQLQNYVVLRDGRGEPLEIILFEKLSRRALTAEQLAALKEPLNYQAPSTDSVEETVELYTWLQRIGKKWQVHQEIGTEGSIIPESEGSYPTDRCPWIPLRMIKVDGEHYGRSYAEEYLGDLFSLERLSQAIVELTATIAKIVHMVDPGGVTDPDDIADATSGDVIPGNAKDVTTLLVEKQQDLRVASEQASRIEDRLEQAFLLMSGIQRNAERVTAEEIRRLAEELEQALGGVYSLLSDELQTRLVAVLMHQNKRLPKLPKDSGVNLNVVTGVAALGRNHDLVKLDTFVAGVLEVAGPEAVATYLNLSSYLERRAAALNLPIEGMIRSDTEAQALIQQRQMADAMKQAGGAMVGYLDNRAKAAETSGE